MSEERTVAANDGQRAALWVRASRKRLDALPPVDSWPELPVRVDLARGPNDPNRIVADAYATHLSTMREARALLSLAIELCESALRRAIP